METEKKTLYRALETCYLERQIEKTGDTDFKGTAVFEFPPSYPGFKGHFPGQPVLPAIVQLASVRFFAESVLHCKLTPVEYSKIKFRDVVLPGDRVIVLVNFTKTEETWKASFSLTKQGSKQVATGTISFLL